MPHIVEIFRDDIMPKVEAETLPILQATHPEILTVHYEHGHYTEIDQTLRQLSQAKSFFNKRYPLVALFEDVAETRFTSEPEVRLTIIICHLTKTEYKSGDRYANVINPILEPIYKSLLRQILLSGKFMEYKVRHRKIVRPYWGLEGKHGNRGNIMSDTLDAIELQDLRLRVYDEVEC